MKENKICWDSCVMISHFRGDRDVSETQAIESVVDKLDEGHYNLVISTLLYAEVLASVMPKNAMSSFNKFVKRRDTVTNVPVTLKIAEKAQEIRNKTKIGTPDAIHIATAIIGEALVFHTFDTDLIRLNGQDVVDGLEITPCHIPGTTIPIHFPLGK